MYQHLQAVQRELAKSSQQDAKQVLYWSRKKPGAYVIHVLGHLQQYHSWLLAAAPLSVDAEAFTSYATNSNSSSTGSGSSSSKGRKVTTTSRPSDNSVHVGSSAVHAECLALCLRLLTTHLRAGLHGAVPLAAAVRAHLLDPATGAAHRPDPTPWRHCAQLWLSCTAHF